MGLVETLRSWLGLGGDADQTETETAAGDTVPTDASGEAGADADREPRLDPEGAAETRVETTEHAVDALKQARNTADAPERDEATETGDPKDTNDEDGSGETADAGDHTDR